MQMVKGNGILREEMQVNSVILGRAVQVDLYMPAAGAAFREGTGTTLLLINDGQDLAGMGFSEILDDLYGRGLLAPLLCAGIHAGTDRMMEYGTSDIPDYAGRGAKAAAYARFVFDELIPAIRSRYTVPEFREKAFAGFSLGALSAMDIVWQHPHEFRKAGLFSGSFWWRKRDKSDPSYKEEEDRIMQKKIREGGYYPWLRFFFECGTEDEKEDRNHNGIIDSIDDTQDLIRELVKKGYSYEFNAPDGKEGASDIRYLEITGGRHEIATWARAMPVFLLWGWGKAKDLP